MADIPDHYETDEGTRSRRAKHPEDIFCLVKEYICSPDLRQQPLLVLTHEDRQTFPLTTSSVLFTQKPVSFLKMLKGNASHDVASFVI